MADFVRRSELWTYDVFPKVIETEKYLKIFRITDDTPED